MKNRNAVTLAAVILVSSASVFASGSDNQGTVQKVLGMVAKPAKDHPLVAGLCVGAALAHFGPGLLDTAANKSPWKTQARKDALAAADTTENRKRADAALKDGPKKSQDYVDLVTAVTQAEAARVNKLKELVGKDASLVAAPAPAAAPQPVV